MMIFVYPRCATFFIPFYFLEKCVCVCVCRCDVHVYISSNWLYRLCVILHLVRGTKQKKNFYSSFSVTRTITKKIKNVFFVIM